MVSPDVPRMRRFGKARYGGASGATAHPGQDGRDWFRKPQVVGSSPTSGSTRFACSAPVSGVGPRIKEARGPFPD